MDASSILCLFRKYHDKTTLDISNELKVPLEEYNSIEAGGIIDCNLAQNLSKIYNVPCEIFLWTRKVETQDFKFLNSPFNSSNGYVHNLYQQDLRIVELLIQSKDDTIRLLKDEVIRLREENKILVEQLLTR